MTERPPARIARERAGLTLERVAQRVRVTPAYLRSLERTGRFSYPLAVRLVRLYGGGSTLNDFLPTKPRAVARQR
jgi:transcriptional regulator with XRE-family HTH domain